MAVGCHCAGPRDWRCVGRPGSSKGLPWRGVRGRPEGRLRRQVAPCEKALLPMRLLRFRARRAGLALLVLLAGLSVVRGPLCVAQDSGPRTTDNPRRAFYDIALVLDVAGRQADVRQRVTWVNPGPAVVGEL